MECAQATAARSVGDGVALGVGDGLALGLVTASELEGRRPRNPVA